ncbi:MAG: response regulator [Anaerolineae bacterium]|nr:response regulator [Anaerolineae bacterium]
MKDMNGMDFKEKTILIVEDSPAQMLALQQTLAKAGLKVLWAPDGQVGVFMAQQNLPDAIVLDIEMPRMDGFEACQHLKENAQTASIPVIMLTAHANPATLTRGITLGALDFIPKDVFSGPVLLETLRQLNILDDIAAAEEDRVAEEA